MNFNKETLKNLYFNDNLAVSNIAIVFGCSEHKINYWFRKYGIKKRTISESIYLKHNPFGDPFKFKNPKTSSDWKLFGMGLGLYWGEGNKANKNTVRLGNSDPGIIKIFIRFLDKFFGVKKSKLKFHLHLFSDMGINEATDFWIKELRVKKSQFYKPTVTKTGKLGNYKAKSKYGVLTIIYGNTKLRNILVNFLLK